MDTKVTLLPELIVKAIKMGATDLEFKLSEICSGVVLPHEVLESETLVRLSVQGCKVDLGADRKVSCSRLKSLSFGGVYLVGDILWDIISRCPLIEELSLSHCKFFSSSSSYYYASDRKEEMLELSPFVEFGKKNVGSVLDGPIHLYQFHKLKSLSLCYVDIHHMFFCDFSSKFPCIKDLNIDMCGGYNSSKIEISSNTVECVSFKQMRVLRATFDAPNIRKFSFHCRSLPSLTFRRTSREWESDIFLSCDNPSTSWFLKLKKLLTSFSQSKISLSFGIGYITEKSVQFQSVPKTAVENLTMWAPSSACSTLLQYVFWTCRPKFITLDWLPKSRILFNRNNSIIKILGKRLMQGQSENRSTPNQDMSGLNDLKEVNVELFEEKLAEWQPLPWKILLDSPKGPKVKQKIRFQLIWEPESSTLK